MCFMHAIHNQNPCLSYLLISYACNILIYVITNAPFYSCFYMLIFTSVMAENSSCSCCLLFCNRRKNVSCILYLILVSCFIGFILVRVRRQSWYRVYLESSNVCLSLCCFTSQKDKISHVGMSLSISIWYTLPSHLTVIVNFHAFQNKY